MTARDYTPREWQPPMIQHIYEVERCALFCPMGSGKTVATYTALDSLFLAGEDHPVLVLAPLRVARSTWPDEARKWKHLRNISVMPIVGSEAERRAALRYDASVYTTNYENLEWLVNYYGERWPFRTVVADELTKLKSFRVGGATPKKDGTPRKGAGGGVRAGSLAKVAHTKVKRFIGLTGTPSPNGLADLWGQMWFLDGGVRLGRTFGAFKQRWFMKSYDGYGVIAQPHAQEQIQEKLRDLCLTIDLGDYLDIQAPVVNNIFVDLPPRAAALYRDMERKMFMELEGHDVEAFNAAARTIKCLATGTEVLTDKGWKQIQNYAPGDRLWDGVEWVSAGNLVCNGVRDVVECWGVWMTPDHKVLTAEGWREAQEVLDAKPTQKLDRQDVRLPDGADPPRLCAREPELDIRAGNVAGTLHLRPGGSRNWRQPPQPQSGTEEVVRVPAARDAARRLGLPRHDTAPGIPHLVRDASALRQPQVQRLGQLRRAWHQGVQAVASVVHRLLGRYGREVVPGSEHRTGEQQQGLPAGELRLGRAGSAGQQPADQRVFGDAPRVDDRGASVAGICGARADTAPAAPERVGARRSRAQATVYDIVNAGPRHRFTVRGSDGRAFLAHNCLQIANGAAYVDDAGSWKEVHDEKLAALEDIVEEAAGAPILVAYHFKSDLARLQRAFPKGRVLDANPGAIRDWNEGRVPLLFAHPASAGHGLNLQDGGNILVYFGHWWNLEERMQILERIGPTRQLQAGYKRPVFVHNIIARGTVDEDVIERVNSKREVQEILLSAMKRRHG